MFFPPSVLRNITYNIVLTLTCMNDICIRTRFANLFCAQYFWVIFKTTCWCWMIYQVHQVKRNTILICCRRRVSLFDGMMYTKITKKGWETANFDILIQHRINTKTTQYHAESALYENVTFPRWTSEQKLQCREQQYYYTVRASSEHRRKILHLLQKSCFMVHITLRYDWLH